MRSLSSTYRVQLDPGFGFQRLAERMSYFKKLGVSHVYLSPILEARPGSSHGYDVFDFDKVSSQLGGEEGLRILCDTAATSGIGVIVDIVPNHMALENPYLMNVLEKGRGSRYARLFDLRWGDDGKIVVPVLGEPPGEARKKFRVSRMHGKPWLSYGQLAFPLNARARRMLDAAGWTRSSRDDVSTEVLDEIVGAQWYTLTYWKDAAKKIGYRRFFDVNGLIALRQEDPWVFQVTHRTLFRVIDAYDMDGVRVDHVDGLLRPGEYLGRLRERLGERYIFVEKILARGERLPAWPVQGTTGYDFLQRLNSVFVDSENWGRIRRIYEEFTGGGVADPEQGKNVVLNTLFRGDFEGIVSQLSQLAAGVDADAVKRLVLRARCYRTYLSEGGLFESHSVRELAELLGSAEGVLELAGTDFIGKLEQLMPALMGKGFEDTFFFRYSPLISLCEVGCDPRGAGDGLAGFHLGNILAEATHPQTMVATTTHDTKLSEDVRARVNVLSEIPEFWRRALLSWHRISRRLVDAEIHPVDEYRFYQALLGAWNGGGAGFGERINAYMLKTAKESKLRTSWLRPNESYEKSLHRFVDACLNSGEFMDSFTGFWTGVAKHGAYNSVSQTVLKFTSPGVPDTYWGNEAQTYLLVDPDNRRRVDFDLLDRSLDRVCEAGLDKVTAGLVSGDLKLYLSKKMFEFRRLGQEKLRGYTPLYARGRYARNVVAYRRGGVVVAAARFYASLPGEPIGQTWYDTRIRVNGKFRDIVSGESLEFRGDAPLSSVFEHSPVAILVAD